MKELSFAATIAWQAAAGEATAAKHQYIETEHILIGILSLEKSLRRCTGQGFRYALSLPVSVNAGYHMRRVSREYA